jgi:Trk-type K+ transport system membrane component
MSKRRYALLLVAVAFAGYLLFFWFESLGSPRTVALESLEYRIRGVAPPITQTVYSRTQYLTFSLK